MKLGLRHVYKLDLCGANMLCNKVCLLFLLILKRKGLEQGIYGSYKFTKMYIETIIICKWIKYKDLKRWCDLKP
jgi:hypothetical protein